MSILAATVMLLLKLTAATPSSDASAAWQFAVLMADRLLAAGAAAVLAVLRTPQAAVAGHSPNQGCT